MIVYTPRDPKQIKREIKAMRRAGKRIAKTKASARAFLKKIGHKF